MLPALCNVCINVLLWKAYTSLKPAQYQNDVSHILLHMPLLSWSCDLRTVLQQSKSWLQTGACAANLVILTGSTKFTINMTLCRCIYGSGQLGQLLG